MKKLFTLAIAFMTVALTAQTYQDVIKDGHKAYNAKKYAEAAAHYQEAVSLTSVSAEKSFALYYQARALYLQKKFDEADEKFGEVVKIGCPDKTKLIDSLYYLYVHQSKKKNYAEALALMKKIEQTDGKHWVKDNAKLYQAMILIDMKQYAEAEKLLLEIAGDKKQSLKRQTNANYYLGTVSRLQKKYDEAMRYYGKVLSSPESTPDKIYYAHTFRADILIKEKKYDAALAEYEKIQSVPKMSPNFIANSFAMCANCQYYHKKDIVKAKEAIDRAQNVKGATWGKNPGIKKFLDAEFEKRKKK